MALLNAWHTRVPAAVASKPSAVPATRCFTTVPRVRPACSIATDASVSASRNTSIAHRRSSVCQASRQPAVFLFGFGGQDDDEYDETYTVFKLQVGLFGDITKWQRDLERLSTLYDTDLEGGLHAIMMDTLQQLVRNTEYVGYCSSAGRMFNSPEDAEAKFNEVSFDERSKFKEETLVNVDGRTANKASSFRAAEGTKDLDQWLVLTLILAVEREIKLPKVQSVFELKQVLKTLAGVHVDELLAFEMLWTPQDNGDSYSKDELLADYPAMALIS